MAAVNERAVFLCFLVLVCGEGAAGAESAGMPVQIKNQNEVVQLAYEKMQHAISELEKRVLACAEAGEKATVPLRVVSGVSLSDREWEIALAHLSNRARDRCDGNVWGEALLAYTRFRDFEKRVTGANALDTEHVNVDFLCCISVFGRMELELKYQQIDPKIRHTLESIRELNQPFDPVKTLKAMKRAR